MTARKLPYRHLSVRVPWHDTGWEGSICAEPLANGACLRLGRIAEGRNDAYEAGLAGRSWVDLMADDLELPPCSGERAGFMSPSARQVTKVHPYASWNEVYRKFQPTTYDLPAYSADCIPFRWMLRENAVAIADEYQLPYEPDLEVAVDTEASLNNPAWVQHAKNQQLLLDTFFSAVEKERSLFFVYAKESPLSNDPRRILIGVGRTLDVGQVIPYIQNAGGFGSVLWERVIRHSIRPSMEDGFLLPYHELLKMSAEDGVDPEEFAVFVPEESGLEFSYASEHVSHDTALSLLLALDRAVEKSVSDRGRQLAGRPTMAQRAGGRGLGRTRPEPGSWLSADCIRDPGGRPACATPCSHRSATTRTRGPSPTAGCAIRLRSGGSQSGVRNDVEGVDHHSR